MGGGDLEGLTVPVRQAWAAFFLQSELKPLHSMQVQEVHVMFIPASTHLQNNAQPQTPQTDVAYPNTRYLTL